MMESAATLASAQETQGMPDAQRPALEDAETAPVATAPSGGAPLLPFIPILTEAPTLPTPVAPAAPVAPAVATAPAETAPASSPVAASVVPAPAPAPLPVPAPAPVYAPPIEEEATAVIPSPPAQVSPAPPSPQPQQPEKPQKPATGKRRRLWQTVLILVLLAIIAGGIAGYRIISQNPTIYQSSLKGSLDGWQNDHNCAQKQDGYHITASSICYAPVDSQADADVSVTVTQPGGSGDLFYGIILRSTPGQHYYLFGLDGNGEWAFVNIANNSAQPVYLVQPTLDAAIHGGLHQTNTLEVKMKGSRFDFFVNGTQVGEITDGHYTSGLIGLSGEDGVEVVYTNLRINKMPGA
jgi:hypothetical protein